MTKLDKQIALLARELSAHTASTPRRAAVPNPFRTFKSVRSESWRNFDDFTGCVGMSRGVVRQDRKRKSGTR